MTATPQTGSDDPLRTLQVKQRALESRVVSAENAVARLWALLVAGLLVGGQLMSFLTYELDDDLVTPSLLTFGIGGLGYRDEDGDRDAASLLFGIAFTGLSLLTLVAVISLLGIARRSGPRSPRWLAPLAVLLVVGVLGAWLTVLVALGRSGGDDRVDLHAGLPVLTAGVVLYAWLVLSEAGRELWAP